MINSLTEIFRPPAFPGSYFISFEGIEGAGKSTQINHLKATLEKMGTRVILLREPGGTIFGERLRKAVLESLNPLNPLAEAYLFAAARAQLLDEVILKELAIPSTVVICDRYLDSSIAYQGIARGLGVEKILEIHSTFPLHLVPHCTFYLAIDVDTSEERQAKRANPKDYFESENRSFHQKLIEGFETALHLFPERIVKIDATQGEKEVQNQINQHVDRLIKGS